VSVRSWQATPSREIELDGKVWPVVTQEDLIKALLDGAIMLDRAGGCLQVVLQRRPTPMPNEMITVAAVVVWQDRTNAKPQPESPGVEILEPAPAEPPPNGEPTNEDAAALAEALGANQLAELESEVVDESDVPENLRA